MQSQIVGDTFTINILFKDHNNRQQEFSLNYSYQKMAEMANRFKFPKSMMSSGRMSKGEFEQWLQKRAIALKEGLFIIENEKQIRPDYNRIIAYYGEYFCKPIAEQIVKILGYYKADTRRDRIEMAMKFVQDIPYGLPRLSDPNYIFGGMITIPQILFNKFGDCDSKSMFFAGILSFLIPSEDIAFMTVPEHLLTVIREKPESGMTYIPFQGQNYVIAETAGPNRGAYGEPNEYKKGGINIYPLRLQTPFPVIPLQGGSQGTSTTTSSAVETSNFQAVKMNPGDSFQQALMRLAVEESEIKSIVFNGSGGWLIIADKNKVLSDKIPQRILDAIQPLVMKNIDITDAALSSEDEFVLVFNQGRGYQCSLKRKTGNQLVPKITEIIEQRGLPIYDIVFTQDIKPGWLIIYGQKSGIATNINRRLAQSLNPALQRCAEFGIKSIAFAQNHGWVFLHGRNNFEAHLPSNPQAKLMAALRSLKVENQELNRIYFTPNDEWVIVYNQNKIKTSLF